MVDLATVPSFAPERWQNATPDERADALWQLEAAQAAEQGRPACNLEFFEADQKIRGGFNKGDAIYLNNDVLEQNSPHSGVETVAHEGRHAYQWDVVQRPGQHPEASQNRVNNWTYNFSNYARPEDGFADYENQFVEVDANRHAATVSAQLPPEQDYGEALSPERLALLREGQATIPPPPPPPDDTYSQRQTMSF